MVKATRAISRRTGSKLDRVTASGVSSIIRSTPVACSSALILRPSLPIRRPFISSLGRGTTDTVVSTTTSEALRCIVRESISWDFRSASSFSFISHSRNRRDVSCRISVSMASTSCSLASLLDRPEISSSCSSCLSLSSTIWFRTDSISFSLLAMPRSRWSAPSSLRSSVSFFCISRFSCRCTSERRSRYSVSAAALILLVSSLASLNTFLASSLVSPIIRAAFRSAIRICRLNISRRERKAAIPPNTTPMIKLKNIASNATPTLTFHPPLFSFNSFFRGTPAVIRRRSPVPAIFVPRCSLSPRNQTLSASGTPPVAGGRDRGRTAATAVTCSTPNDKRSPRRQGR